MSKRVLILLGVGVLLIVGAFFLLKYELTDKEEDADPDPEPEQKTEIIADGKADETPGAGTEN